VIGLERLAPRVGALRFGFELNTLSTLRWRLGLGYLAPRAGALPVVHLALSTLVLVLEVVLALRTLLLVPVWCMCTFFLSICPSCRSLRSWWRRFLDAACSQVSLNKSGQCRSKAGRLGEPCDCIQRRESLHGRSRLFAKFDYDGILEMEAEKGCHCVLCGVRYNPPLPSS
jgi:hypothetical protein